MATGDNKKATGSPNFAFPGYRDPQLARLGADGERFLTVDPDLTLVRMRQLGKFIAEHAAARTGLYIAGQESEVELVRRLGDRGMVGAGHGNDAVHDARVDHREALLPLKLGRELFVWFHRVFGSDPPSFKPGPFAPPDTATLKRSAAHARI